MKSALKSILAVATVLGLVQPIRAAEAVAKLSIGIQRVEATEAVTRGVEKAGPDKLLSLQRIAESMGQQLIDRVHGTRKFTVVSRSDLNTVLKEQDLQRVLGDPNDANVAQAFKMAGCQYALIVTIDDFQDLAEELRAEGGQVLARKRTIRLSSVAKIYDTSTAKLLESASFLLSEQDGGKVQFGVAADGKGGEQVLAAMPREMSDRVANRVMDVIFPAKILAMTGKLVTINRGDGTGIAKGQVWTVYATGEKLVDPDTGEVLGAEEIPVGKVTIVNVTPKFSHGQITEDLGIDKLQVLRIDAEAKDAR